MDENLVRDSEKIQRLMHRFHHNFGRNMMNSLAQGRINMPQHNTMYVLDEAGEISMGELAERMGVTMGASTNIVDKLVRAGLAVRQRNPKDRRMVTVKLTDDGSTTVQQIVSDCRAFLARVFDDVDAVERVRFMETFEKIAAHSDRQLDESVSGTAAGS